MKWKYGDERKGFERLNENMDLEIKNTAMVFVPHQDDEINLIGNISGRITKMYETYIVYSSLDNEERKAAIRKKEAIEACKILEIDEEHIIFMGFCDNPNKLGSHYFQASEKHIEVVKMITSIIVKYSPDIIFGVDFDYHSDHRMLSIALEESIGNITSKKYMPIVLKGFCYETAYYGKNDYLAVNLGNTEVRNTFVSNPSYEWEKRISIKSNEANGFIWDKKVYRALRKHKSQYAVLHASEIINADNVFWQRRTDNLLLSADVTVSSGDRTKLNDFKIIDTDDILSVDPSKINFEKGVWFPKNEDKKPFIKIKFDEKKFIYKITLHGNPNCKKILKVDGKIIIADREWKFNEISACGRDTDIILNCNFVEDMIICFSLIGDIECFGLSEIEVFSNPKQSADYEELMELINVCPLCKNKIVGNVIELINLFGYKWIKFMSKVCRKMNKLHGQFLKIKC